jgi:hypothetical protein
VAQTKKAAHAIGGGGRLFIAGDRVRTHVALDLHLIERVLGLHLKLPGRPCS